MNESLKEIQTSIERNIGLKIAKKNKCTHFLTSDSDEYYFEIITMFTIIELELRNKRVSLMNSN